MDELVTSLERLIRLCLLERLPEDPSGELAAMDFRNLLVIYGNWRARVPSMTPRATRMSSVLAASPKRVEHEKALDELVAKIEAGADLKDHLSERVETAYVPTSSRGRQHRRKDLDLLLADWGIHHLHLPTATQQRGNDLLFAAFTDRDAYLIDILPHGRWTTTNLIETIVREWPDAGLVHRSRSGAQLKHNWSDADRADMRNAGMSLFVEVDGVACGPPGQTLGGMPIAVSRRVVGLVATLDDWRANAARLLAEHRDPACRRPWLPIIEGEEIGFTDASGLFVHLGRLA